MPDPNKKHKDPYCWHRILYALLRWTIPAAFAVLAIVLSR